MQQDEEKHFTDVLVVAAAAAATVANLAIHSCIDPMIHCDQSKEEKSDMKEKHHFTVVLADGRTDGQTERQRERDQGCFSNLLCT